MDDEEHNMFKLRLQEPELRWKQMEFAERCTLRMTEHAQGRLVTIHHPSSLRLEGWLRFSKDDAQTRKRDFEATTTDYGYSSPGSRMP